MALAAENLAPETAVADPDGKTLWYDCQKLLVEGKGWADTETFYDRLPAKAKGKVRPPVWDLSLDTAGMCVRFSTTSNAIQVRWTVRKGSLAMPHMPSTGVSGVDLYTLDASGRWNFVNNGAAPAQTNTMTFPVVPGQLCLLYLPLYNGIKSIEIGVPKDQTLAKVDANPQKPIVFYGTSITQGGCVSRPGMGMPAIVGRKLAKPGQLPVPTINLGFSGNGIMEPEIADLVSELDPSIFVLDSLWNMSPDLVKERLEPFIKRIRTSHPETPILVAEDSNFRNARTTKGKIARETVEKLTAQGDKHLYYLSNEGMTGDDCEGTVDSCHLTDLGMMCQADVFTKALQPLLTK
jgi:hypothetical protein